MADAAAGDPAKVDWTKATLIGPWHTLYGDEIPERKIKGALAHDGQYLYLSLAEVLDPAKLSSQADIWSGDDWELFVAAERGKAPYRQMGVNPAGKSVAYEWIQAGQPIAWNNNAIIKSNTTGGRWQVLMSIPLADLVPNGVKLGQPFYMNVFRASCGYKGLSCWSPTFKDAFLELTRLAEIVLEQKR